MSKKLVTCFSAGGVTAGKAKELAAAAGADFKEIRPAVKYQPADLDWRDKSSRSTVEMQDPSARPEMAEKIDVSGYDVVYIGFPIWWGVAPRIINTFIESVDLSGKSVVIFATSGGSGIENAVSELKKTYPQMKVAGSRLLNGGVSGDIL